ncbi:MAG: glycosyltransferase family 2 protein [Lachnospiraceae bacterium]|jgi:GT2 family glycosyltransferase|nr:glycosyltransferase family 2 protein [Lachnospiraceae bacterium]
MYKASIIVTISNEYALTENFFKNLFQIINDDINIFTVVDGETDVKTVRFLQELQNNHSNISVIFENENLGFSKANNIGAFRSESPYLIFLNSDTFPVGDALYKMIKFMDSSPDTGVAQGLILYPQSNLVQSAGHIFGFYKTTHVFDGLEQENPVVQKTAERQALASGFYITRRQLFVAEKGFDELFYNAWEGLEYSLKIHARGYKCMYYPEAKAYHVKGSGRNRRFRDESYQTGYFWHRWGEKIRIDLPDIYRLQLQEEDYKYQYLLVNGSSIREDIWLILLKEIPFHMIGQYHIEKSMSKKAISLEDSVPASFLQSRTSLLFVVDNFRDIINNYRVFNYRHSFRPHDMILDLHGNVKYPSE